MRVAWALKIPNLGNGVLASVSQDPGTAIPLKSGLQGYKLTGTLDLSVFNYHGQPPR
jgi:hypothetical protein